MFDFLKNLRRSEAEKRQEAITAYLDDALTAGERRRLEQQMTADPALRADMEQQRLVKVNISRLPRIRAPRNFTLDPALYGRPARQGSMRLYPAMRVATVLVGVFFIIAVGAEILLFNSSGFEASAVNQIGGLAPAADVMLESEPEMAQDMAAAAPESLPQTGSDSEGVVSEGEVTVEEEQLEEAPAEAPGLTADEDMAEIEEAAEESFAAIIVTRVVETAVEKIVTGEAAAESAPRAPTSVGEPGGADGEPPAEADDGQAVLPSGGGGEPEEATLPDAVMTGEAGRSAPAATEIATSQPTPTMVVAPPEDVVAEAPGEALPEALELLPVESEPAPRQDIGSGLPTRQLILVLLGAILILLAGVTLILRWRQKKQL